MNPTPSKAIAYRIFTLLRRNVAGWKLDAAGFWAYPALSVDHQGRLLWLFIVLMAVPLPQKKRTALFRPKAIVVTRAGTPDVVRYENLRSGHDPFPTLDWAKPKAMFPHKSVGGLSNKEFELKEAELLGAYPSAGAQFLKNRTLPDSFVKQYVGLIHPVFLPFIRHLAPQFFAALGVEKASQAK